MKSQHEFGFFPLDLLKVIGSLNNTIDDVKQSNWELAQVLTKKLINSRQRGLSKSNMHYHETIFIACII